MSGLFHYLKSLFLGTTYYKMSSDYTMLRRHLLTRFSPDESANPGTANYVWGIVMETGDENALSSVIILRDGTVKTYFSKENHLADCTQNNEIRTLGKSLIAKAFEYVGYMKSTQTYPLPDTGHTRFFLLTATGIFTTDYKESQLAENRASLSPLFFLAHSIFEKSRQLH